ncbi:formate dehydrogenase-N subunit alpha [Oceanisphaera avium]|uniref:Formate dehydrogenase-N subunit alpha n=1 Tax=Oceanisphaera avium TaxID=1903694 RepID=A0A1Y0CYR2_9GAMM|nr:formate dehydrogenase-N subunit alpha [Oceanisphaera avium]
MAGLAPTFGRGAMTNHWVDIKNADVVLIMGGNAAEAHPCGFKWVTEAKAHNNATLIVVDPRFNRSASVADVYAPIRTGTDIVFLGGVIKYLLDTNQIQHEYVKNYTDLSFLVDEDFDFEEGIFSGYNDATSKYEKSSWDYQLDENGEVIADPTLQHPRSVYQLLKQHYQRYTPEMVNRVCGTPIAKFNQICKLLASTHTPDRAGTILYALGWTQHSIGSQIIRTGAMMQLLLGNIGIAGGGMNALRGHSNIQGLTDLGLMTNLLPGYMTLPNEAEQDFDGYITKRTQKPLRDNQMSYWQNYKKFHISLAKAWWGDHAQESNNYAFDLLPKLDKPYDMLQVYELMNQGKMNGYICQGFNPLAAAPNKAKMIKSLSQLKFMVIMDPLVTETSEFWRNMGESNDVSTADIQTEVFRLPTSCFAEEAGTLVNSGRWLQWHWKATEPPGEAQTDIEIMATLYQHIRKLYQEEGGTFSEPITELSWPYANPNEPTAEELAKELNGRALTDLLDSEGKVVRKAGEQLSSFSELRDDGSTLSGCWIYTGSWTEQGNMMARRDSSDPTGIGQTLNWAWAWPANRRVLYNRASCDVNGQPFDPTRSLVHWDGAKWTGADVPDFKVTEQPADGMGPFIMNPEGVARFFARDKMAEGPFPTHYEPFETPLGYNPLFKENARATNNPAARMFSDDRAELGKVSEFPYVGTTYRLTEHFHYWSKNVLLNSIIQPQQFVEIGAELAGELGITEGDLVKVSSNRGYIKAKAVVTKRIRGMDVDGKRIHHIGIPIHWGFVGLTKPGFLANTLTPSVGDANSQTPEFKSFLVNVEKV